MAIKCSTPEQQAKAQALIRAEVGKPPTQEIVNTPAVENLGGLQYFRHGRRTYIVKPVPYVPGLKLQTLFLKLEELKDQPETFVTLAKVQEYLTEAAVLFKELCVPRSWWRRMFWRWTKNPFIGSSEAELAQLLGFFFSCRTMSRIGVLSASGQEVSLSLEMRSKS